MKLFYADHFVLPLPAGHRFPMEKYSMLRTTLRSSGRFAEADFLVPAAASDAEILRCHDRDYLQRVANGLLSAEETRRIGFPWSAGMVERSRRSAGATLAACRTALTDGCGVNMAGGTHHAHRDFGAGFCVFNDAAIAARAMQAEGRVGTVAIIDCDVHQGDGTASILDGDASIFTFSMHGARNYPFRKARSDLDIELEDATGDASYLAHLGEGLERVFAHCRPELVIYLAGADPFIDDRLGRLALSRDGLLARDRMVLETCRRHSVPIAIAMAGGYARNIADTVAIHAATILLASEHLA
ncbi:MAG: histone deacetylase [Rhodocyclaceae bacterium]|nr:histone deacetylase [Zoogloeaceae bacterium]